MLHNIAPGLETESGGDVQRTCASGLMDAANRTTARALVHHVHRALRADGTLPGRKPFSTRDVSPGAHGVSATKVRTHSAAQHCRTLDSVNLHHSLSCHGLIQ